MQRIQIYAKQKSVPEFIFPKHFLICYSVMVRHIDLSWNTLESSLILMHEKLTDLGWTYYNGEIHINEPTTDGSNFHAN